MTNDEIHDLADKHKDAYIYEGVDIIGYEFALTSVEKLCREAFNSGLEAAAKVCDELEKRDTSTKPTTALMKCQQKPVTVPLQSAS